MTFLEAQQTARRLFGNVKLHRGKHQCFVIDIVTDMPIGNGKSWLEALRSAGEYHMMKNAMREAEMAHVAACIEGFKAAHPEMKIDGDKFTDEQLEAFDAFVVEFEKTHPNPVPKPKLQNPLYDNGRPLNEAARQASKMQYTPSKPAGILDPSGKVVR